MAESPAPSAGISLFSFSTMSSGVGFVSGIVGIIQFFQDQGPKVVDRIWNSLYVMGFIAVMGIVLGSLAMMAGLWIVSKLNRRPSDEMIEQSPTLFNWIFVIVAIGLGVALGLPWAKHNQAILELDALERMKTSQQAISPLLMRLIGAAALLLPLLALILNRLLPKTAETAKPG